MRYRTDFKHKEIVINPQVSKHFLKSVKGHYYMIQRYSSLAPKETIYTVYILRKDDTVTEADLVEYCKKGIHAKNFKRVYALQNSFNKVYKTYISALKAVYQYENKLNLTGYRKRAVL